jgi:pyruvate kinase
MIKSLFDAGVDMFRLNFSHGTHDDHKKRFEVIGDVERDVRAISRLPKRWRA